MSKTAVVVFSDPKSGSEEALGRLFNALFLTYDLSERGQEVALVFQGTGTRWAAELAKASHPAHALYERLARHVAGVCGGCADVFGASAAAEASGHKLVRNLTIPGVGGVISLADYRARGYDLILF